MKLSITDVHVGLLTENSDQYSLGWAGTGKDGIAYRFHVWLDRATLQHDRSYESSTDDFTGKRILYKNPPKGTPHRGPGWFDTRYLDADTPDNLAMVNRALYIAVAQQLFKAAEDKVLADIAKREAEARVEWIKTVKTNNAEALYTALDELLALMAGEHMGKSQAARNGYILMGKIEREINE